MRILYLTPYVPDAIRTRPYNLLKAMAGRGHALTLLCVAQGDGLFARRPSAAEEAALAELRACGIRAAAVVLPRWRSLLNCLLALPSATPLQAVYCWSPTLARQLAVELGPVSSRFTPPAAALPTPSASLAAPALERYDVFHIEHLRAARYGLCLGNSKFEIRNSNCLHPPIVWDSVDCISHLFAQSAERSRNLFGRVVTRLELPRTRRYEAMLLRAFDHALVTSAVDQAAFAALRPEPQGVNFQPPTSNLQLPTSNLQPPTVLPNGVNLARFCPGDAPLREPEIVFSGKMSYHANVTAALYLAQEVMPLIWQERPDARLIIAGSGPPAAVQSLAGPRVAVTGYVSDLASLLRRAAVAAAPMPYGAGIQNKVLEAMACGTPVVATPQAVSALAAQAGAEVLVGTNAAELAAHVVRLLGDPAAARRIGAAGRAYVERQHDWASIAERLEQVYGEEIGKTRPALPPLACGERPLPSPLCGEGRG